MWHLSRPSAGLVLAETGYFLLTQIATVCSLRRTVNPHRLFYLLCAKEIQKAVLGFIIREPQNLWVDVTTAVIEDVTFLQHQTKMKSQEKSFFFN